jgi:hypothetical protein
MLTIHLRSLSLAMERLGVTNVSAITLVQEAQRIELEFRQGDATTAAHHLEPPNSSSMYAAENHSAVTRKSIGRFFCHYGSTMIICY